MQVSVGVVVWGVHTGSAHVTERAQVEVHAVALAHVAQNIHVAKEGRQHNSGVLKLQHKRYVRTYPAISGGQAATAGRTGLTSGVMRGASV